MCHPSLSMELYLDSCQIRNSSRFLSVRVKFPADTCRQSLDLYSFHSQEFLVIPVLAIPVLRVKFPADTCRKSLDLYSFQVQQLQGLADVTAGFYGSSCSHHERLLQNFICMIYIKKKIKPQTIKPCMLYKSSSQIIACDITLSPIIWFPFIKELCTARLIVILSINLRFELAYIQEMKYTMKIITLTKYTKLR